MVRLYIQISVILTSNFLLRTTTNKECLAYPQWYANNILRNRSLYHVVNKFVYKALQNKIHNSVFFFRTVHSVLSVSPYNKKNYGVRPHFDDRCGCENGIPQLISIPLTAGNIMSASPIIFPYLSIRINLIKVITYEISQFSPTNIQTS